MFAIVMLISVFAALHAPGLGSAPDPVRVASAAADATEASEVRLRDLAFLEGSWGGAMGDGYVEEHWSSPHGASVIGMLRWHNADGRPSMFELIAITEEAPHADAAPLVIMRLRHFSGTLVPVEGRDDPMTLRLTSADPKGRKATFTATPGERRIAEVTYECPEPDRLVIVVSFPEAVDPRRPLRFDLKRLPVQQ